MLSIRNRARSKYSHLEVVLRATEFNLELPLRATRLDSDFELRAKALGAKSSREHLPPALFRAGYNCSQIHAESKVCAGNSVSDILKAHDLISAVKARLTTPTREQVPSARDNFESTCSQPDIESQALALGTNLSREQLRTTRFRAESQCARPGIAPRASPLDSFLGRNQLLSSRSRVGSGRSRFDDAPSATALELISAENMCSWPDVVHFGPAGRCDGIDCVC